MNAKIQFVTEQPPRGGPAAAVSAGLAVTSSELVVVLACDMPFVHATTVQRLLEAANDSLDGAMLVDGSGRKQYLAAAYHSSRLSAALDTLDPITNAPLHLAVSALTVREVQADPDEAFDVDTWADVERSRRLWEER
jgi:molybdopterin-guanine dinucleotide biosynthesis protein A